MMAQLARDLGITPAAISHWEVVPLARLLDVERLTGIPRAKLRPDLFAKPKGRKAARR